MVVATLCERLAKLAIPLMAVAVSVPCKIPLPAFREAVTMVVLSLAMRLPNESSIRISGWSAKAAPAVAVAEGCFWITSLLARAGLMATFAEVTDVRLPLVKSIVIVVARLCERFAKLTTPLSAVAVSVPCKIPMPALREAVTRVLLSVVTTLPNESTIRMTGWGRNAAPAVAVGEGCC